MNQRSRRNASDAGPVHTVTGAYGYSGKYIAKFLLEEGVSVQTLTNSLNREHPFGNRVPAFPLDFERPERLVKPLRNTDVLYNTYWVRFDYDDEQVSFAHDTAVRNSRILLEAAVEAGVERVVHVSITNPSPDSPFPYFRGKAEVEQAVRQSGLSYSILRPALLFGGADILVNNIAWMLRTFPVFGVFGSGRYRVEPIHVRDFASLAVDEGKRREDRTVDAIGPDTFTYRDMVRTIGEAIGAERPIVSIPPWMGTAISTVLGWVLADVPITREEIHGLQAGLLHTDSPPAGSTSLRDWARENRDRLGRTYRSELARRRDRSSSYEDL